MHASPLAVVAGVETDSSSRFRAWILLSLLFAAYSCGAIDRLVMALLVEPIKADLQITDTQIGVLQGPAFVVAYILFCLPAGWLVDRVNRIRFISTGVALWSAMSALCGFAGQYVTLLLARAGVGVGEATLSPAAYSLIGDSFPRERQGLALGIYSAGSAVGAGLALIVAGYVVSWVLAQDSITLPLIGERAAWQLTFFFVGLPGLALAALIYIFPEPTRQAKSAVTQVSQFGSFLRAHWRLLACHHLAVGFSQAVLIGGSAWVAAFLARVHGWPIRSIGLAAGLATIVGGLIGLLGGGALSDMLFRRGPSLRLALCAVAAAFGSIAALSFPLVDDAHWAMVLFAITVTCASLPFGAANAALQHLAGPDIRGRLSSVYIFSLNLVGSLGPVAVGGFADRYNSGPESLRYALASVLCSFMLAAAVLYWMCLGPYSRAVRSR